MQLQVQRKPRNCESKGNHAIASPKKTSMNANPSCKKILVRGRAGIIFCCNLAFYMCQQIMRVARWGDRVLMKCPKHDILKIPEIFLPNNQNCLACDGSMWLNMGSYWNRTEPYGSWLFANPSWPDSLVTNENHNPRTWSKYKSMESNTIHKRVCNVLVTLCCGVNSKEILAPTKPPILYPQRLLKVDTTAENPC